MEFASQVNACNVASDFIFELSFDLNLSDSILSFCSQALPPLKERKMCIEVFMGGLWSKDFLIDTSQGAACQRGRGEV